MTLAELREGLEAILVIESEEITDWAASEALCLDLIRRLSEGPEPDYPHEIVYHFLDDPDVRRKDAQYASMQRKRLRSWLG